MSWLVNHTYNILRPGPSETPITARPQQYPTQPTPIDDPHQTAEKPQPVTEVQKDRYHPSVEDVLRVKRGLGTLSQLPLDIVDAIIDDAEYWPRTVTKMPPGTVRILGSHEMENKLILRSTPLGFSDSIDIVRNNDYYRFLPTRDNISESLEEPTSRLMNAWMENSAPRGAVCRKIVFTIKSNDQGWGGSDPGTYKTSYTWFDVGLEKICVIKKEQENTDSASPSPANNFPQLNSPEAKLDEDDAISIQAVMPCLDAAAADESDDPDHKFHHSLHAGNKYLQMNLTATHRTQDHRIVWRWDDDTDADSLEGEKLVEQGRGAASHNGEFVRSLKPGHIVTLWAKARFPGWVNVVKYASIEVFWAV